MKKNSFALRRLASIVPIAALVAAAVTSCENTSFFSVLGNKAQVQKLAISPSSTTVPPNGSISFSASGGVPPYVFSILSGVGTINSSSGVYTAPATPGTTIIQVTDKQGSTATATVTNVDYSVTAVTDTSTSHFAGSAGTGTFTVQNVGTANGAQTISWTVYLSTTNALGAGDTVFTAGTATPLASGAGTTISFSGIWPTTPGTYYLIATVSAPDGLVAANNTAPSASIAISAANVDYAVTSTTVGSASVVPAGTVSGTFLLTNNGPTNGTQYVTWQIYASTTTSVTGSSVLVTSGTTPPLGSGGSVSIPYSGPWPLTFGNYYVVAKVSVPVDVDVVPSNNTNATAASYPVGFFNAGAFEPGNNVVTTAPSTGVTLQRGMSISITGSLSTADTTDFVSFNTGTATSVSLSMTWASTTNMGLYVTDATGVVLNGFTTTSYTSLSMLWAVDLANTVRCIEMQETGVSAGAYTLIVTAN